MNGMQAYKGIVKDGKVILAEGVQLPEGAQVTVTIGEAEFIRAKLRASFGARLSRRIKAKTPAFIALQQSFEQSS